MTILQLQYFQAVYEYRNMTRAANALYVSQPSVSTAIQELEDEFNKFASAAGMVGIKGHRSVGGFRASLYNAMPKSSVEALVACMKEFERLH